LLLRSNYVEIATTRLFVCSSVHLPVYRENEREEERDTERERRERERGREINTVLMSW
jgi:hypothetical protein